jgi:hypothetical protein
MIFGLLVHEGHCNKKRRLYDRSSWHQDASSRQVCLSVAELGHEKEEGPIWSAKRGGRLVFHRHLKWSKTFINDTTPSLGTTVNTLNVHGLGWHCWPNWGTHRYYFKSSGTGMIPSAKFKDRRWILLLVFHHHLIKKGQTKTFIKDFCS